MSWIESFKISGVRVAARGREATFAIIGLASMPEARHPVLYHSCILFAHFFFLFSFGLLFVSFIGDSVDLVTLLGYHGAHLSNLVDLSSHYYVRWICIQGKPESCVG